MECQQNSVHRRATGGSCGSGEPVSPLPQLRDLHFLIGSTAIDQFWMGFWKRSVFALWACQASRWREMCCTSHTLLRYLPPSLQKLLAKKVLRFPFMLVSKGLSSTFVSLGVTIPAQSAKNVRRDTITSCKVFDTAVVPSPAVEKRSHLLLLPTSIQN